MKFPIFSGIPGFHTYVQIQRKYRYEEKKAKIFRNKKSGVLITL